jgi:hypothetical protein
VARIKADASRSATTPADGPLVYATEATSLPKTESAAQVSFDSFLSNFLIRYRAHTKEGKAKEFGRGSRFAIKIQQSSKVISQIK